MFRVKDAGCRKFVKNLLKWKREWLFQFVMNPHVEPTNNRAEMGLRHSVIYRKTSGGYTILKDYCNKLRKDRRIQAVYRYETKPGKQSQVDFGDFGYIDIDGKRRKLYAFSMILGYSRMRYVEFTADISTENVIKMHLNAFSFFGGFTDTILYDNMKQVVIDRKMRWNFRYTKHSSPWISFWIPPSLSCIQVLMKAD